MIPLTKHMYMLQYIHRVTKYKSYSMYCIVPYITYIQPAKLNSPPSFRQAKGWKKKKPRLGREGRARKKERKKISLWTRVYLSFRGGGERTLDGVKLCNPLEKKVKKQTQTGKKKRGWSLSLFLFFVFHTHTHTCIIHNHKCNVDILWLDNYHTVQ